MVIGCAAPDPRAQTPAKKVRFGVDRVFGQYGMKKWAVLVYAGFFVLNQVIMFTTGIWNVFALIIPAVVIVIGLAHFSEMT
jgi:hypothetical protein